MDLTLDIIAPNYLRAVKRWPYATSLKNHYDLLAQNHTGNNFGLIEVIKSFVESVCITILGEFGSPLPNNPNTTDLLVEALTSTGMSNSRGASKFDRVLSSYNRLSDALIEVRNSDGPIAHGKDGFFESLSNNQKLVFLLLGDTILNLLLSAYERTEPDLRYTREPYEVFEKYNRAIDSSLGMEAQIEEEDSFQTILIRFKTAAVPEGLELRVEPSFLLFAADRGMYVELLNSSRMVKEPEEDLSLPKEEVIYTKLPSFDESDNPVEFVLSQHYTGPLNDLRGQLALLLNSMDFSSKKSTQTRENLLESVLATAEKNMFLDWNKRDTLQARMKIGFKRILLHFGLNQDDAVVNAEQLLRWFLIQTTGMKIAQPQ